MTNRNPALLKAIGVQRLIEYFEYLDELRESGETNMFGAGTYLRKEYAGMSTLESDAVLSAWMSQSCMLPATDRACNVIEPPE